jgi:hypothetical protein
VADQLIHAGARKARQTPDSDRRVAKVERRGPTAFEYDRGCVHLSDARLKRAPVALKPQAPCTRDDARAEVFDFAEPFYNRRTPDWT